MNKLTVIHNGRSADVIVLDSAWRDIEEISLSFSGDGTVDAEDIAAVIEGIINAAVGSFRQDRNFPQPSQPTP